MFIQANGSADADPELIRMTAGFGFRLQESIVLRRWQTVERAPFDSVLLEKSGI